MNARPGLLTIIILGQALLVLLVACSSNSTATNPYTGVAVGQGSTDNSTAREVTCRDTSQGVLITSTRNGLIIHGADLLCPGYMAMVTGTTDTWVRYYQPVSGTAYCTDTDGDSTLTVYGNNANAAMSDCQGMESTGGKVTLLVTTPPTTPLAPAPTTACTWHYIWYLQELVQDLQASDSTSVIDAGPGSVPAPPVHAARYQRDMAALNAWANAGGTNTAEASALASELDALASAIKATGKGC